MVKAKPFASERSSGELSGVTLLVTVHHWKVVLEQLMNLGEHLIHVFSWFSHLRNVGCVNILIVHDLSNHFVVLVHVFLGIG